MIELSMSERRVLRTLEQIGHPVGYFGLVARLELHARQLEGHLLQILERLCALDLVAAQQAPGFRSAAYAITTVGSDLLRTEYPLDEL